MVDIYKKLDGTVLDATDDADTITKHMTSCSHVVLQIDGIKAGTNVSLIYPDNFGIIYVELLNVATAGSTEGVCLTETVPP